MTAHFPGIPMEVAGLVSSYEPKPLLLVKLNGHANDFHVTFVFCFFIIIIFIFISAGIL